MRVASRSDGFGLAQKARRASAVLGALLLATPGIVQAQFQGKWVEVKSEHFRVVCNGSERQARDVDVQLEQMRAVFLKLLPAARTADPTPIRVLAVKDDADVQALMPLRRTSQADGKILGAFFPGAYRSYMLLELDPNGDTPFHAIYHEYTHFLLSRVPRLPLWLNEGLAEFYAASQIREKYVVVGNSSSAHVVYLRAPDHEAISLQTLFAADENSPYYHEGGKMTAFYADAWALTHMLMLNDRLNGTHKVQDYLDAVATGQSSVAAAETVFGGFRKLQAQLDAHVASFTFKAVEIEASVTMDPKALHATPVAPAEALALQGDLMMRQRAQSEGLRYVKKALELDPNNAEAHRALALSAILNHDPAGALPELTTAIKLAPDDFEAQLLFGLTSEQARSGEDAAIVAAYKRSMELNPHLAPPVDFLAVFYTAKKIHLDEAHALARRAVLLDPTSLTYRLHAADVWAAEGAYEAAGDVLKAAQKFAVSANQQARLAKRIAENQKAIAGTQAAGAAATPSPGAAVSAH